MSRKNQNVSYESFKNKRYPEKGVYHYCDWYFQEAEEKERRRLENEEMKKKMRTGLL